MKSLLQRSLLAGFATLVLSGFVTPSATSAAPFPFLQPGFTQSLWGVYPNFLGGVAFASDGDAWVDFCAFSGSPLLRFDRQTTVLVNGTLIHPLVGGVPFASNAGCGLTTHPNGSLYSNTSSGVVQLDGNTAAQTGGPFGPAGNALGIAVNPNAPYDMVYVGSDGTLYKVNAALSSFIVFSLAVQGSFVDGISWDPTGAYLFLANRSPNFRLTILRADGTLVQHVPMTSEPDGISFNSSQNFVVTNNTDGTMTRFDFAGNNFSLVPVVSLFASGGFRGDLSQVGTEGCIYLTQDGARYDDGTVTTENSVVRICGDFTPVDARPTTWGKLKASYR